MSFIISILFIQLVIFVHELGHYLAAKKAGVDVYEFSIGMGPKIFEFKKNETLYVLRAIPLLGHVLFEELDEDSEDNEYKEIILSENHLKKKGFLTEVSVYLAGPFFNFLTALLVILGIYLFSGFPSTTISTVLKDSPAQYAGIKQGDTILSINDIKINNWDDVSNTINTLKKDEINIKIQKSDGSIKNILTKTQIDNKTNRYSIGITPEYKHNLLESIKSSFVNIARSIKENILALNQLFFGWIPGVGDSSYKVELTGPIGTIQTVSEQVNNSITSLLLMFASFNINVGVINLIPFVPILDGGQTFIRCLEAIRRKSFKTETVFKLKFAGATFLFGLMILTTLKDILNLF